MVYFPVRELHKQTRLNELTFDIGQKSEEFNKNKYHDFVLYSIIMYSIKHSRFMAELLNKSIGTQYIGIASNNVNFLSIYL